MRRRELNCEIDLSTSNTAAAPDPPNSNQVELETVLLAKHLELLQARLPG